MIVVRKSGDRGHFDHGWLDTYHSFSFADYYDEVYMGFRTLRVINEDVVKPTYGFGKHPHRDMEIVTYMISGALTHEDSLGHRSTIRPGNVQRMSAGRGVVHSEVNESKDKPVHLLQIWILPDEKSREPEYEEKNFPVEGKTNRLRLIISPDGREKSMNIHQDVLLFDTRIERCGGLSYNFDSGRHGWIQVISGDIQVNGQKLAAGDGASISGESKIEIAAEAKTDLLLFDLS